MTPKGGHLSPELEEALAKAEAAVSRYFQECRGEPGRGIIEISGERYVLIRAGALSVEFFDLVRDLYGPERRCEADDFARNILFDLAHAFGKSDAHILQAKLKLTDPIARMAAGPAHFAHTGWADVELFPESVSEADPERFFSVYDHPVSFEADAWARAGRTPIDFPVCIMNAGYSAGWCEECFGLKLVASEILCRAKGDATCRFIMAHPSQIEEHIANYMQRQPQLAPTMKNYAVPDLFARKRMEDELREAHDELEDRVRLRTQELTTSNELLKQEMAERAQVERKLRQAAKMEAIGRLSGGIAHDFNNLLAVILTRTDLLLRRLGRLEQTAKLAEAIADVDEIKKASERAAKLTRQLLAFGRAQVLRHETLELNDVVGDLARTMVPLVGEDVILVPKLSAERLYVYADRGQIEQAMMNVVVNARDAMPSGGSLTIETAAVELSDAARLSTGELRAGRYNVLTLSDTGDGMSEEILSQIFDPFFTTKPPGKGTGLGLSTVYGAVQQSRGGIDVASTPGRGTTFAIYLPAVEPQEKPPRTVVSPPRWMTGTETVLLAEDERELRRGVAEVLRECGYRVLEARSPEEALAMAEQNPETIDLLITDVIMPKMGGGELAQRVMATRPRIRILFMSGYAPDAAIHGTLFEAGATLLVKPFLPDELARKIREVLDR
ncbi:ATP-binding protein [Pendulispora albinea]|uniref:histidine kinase n=1 Tax=Pendulispora albinea TaxID=2741071 RepID=A0ABZ2M5I2_9BACT